jgi:methionyl-tRNA formyltransferase
MIYIFLGSGDFASGILDILSQRGNCPVCSFTYCPKEKGRGHKAVQDDVAIVSEKHDIECFETDDINSVAVHDKMKSLEPDFGLVISFSILDKETFSIPKSGMINLHPSLLPDLRGAAPLNWAIRRGYRKSGFSTFFLTSGVDCGKILLQEEFDILEDENAGQLRERLILPAANHLEKVFLMLKSNDYKLSEQGNNWTKAPR